MKRLRRLLAALLLLLSLSAFLGACGGKEVKEPTENVLTAEDAFSLAESVRKVYVARDFEAMGKYTTDKAFEDIKRNLKTFRSVELDFTPRWVEIKEDGTVHLYIAWKGTWTLKDGKEERRGLALFELTGRPPRIAGILRNSPFSQPE